MNAKKNPKHDSHIIAEENLNDENAHLLMNMDDKQVANQRIIGLLIFLCFFIPLFVYPFLNKDGLRPFGALVFVVCYVAMIVLAVKRRRLVYDSFFKVKDAYLKTRIIEVHDADTIRELDADSSVVMPGEPDKLTLNYLYNFFYNEGLVRDEMINVYTFQSDLLADVFPDRQLGEDTKLCCVFLKELGVTDKEKFQLANSRNAMHVKSLRDYVK